MTFLSCYGMTRLTGVPRDLTDFVRTPPTIDACIPWPFIKMPVPNGPFRMAPKQIPYPITHNLFQFRYNFSLIFPTIPATDFASWKSLSEKIPYLWAFFDRWVTVFAVASHSGIAIAIEYESRHSAQHAGKKKRGGHHEK
jgi:hypothetical protein